MMTIPEILADAKNAAKGPWIIGNGTIRTEGTKLPIADVRLGQPSPISTGNLMSGAPQLAAEVERLQDENISLKEDSAEEFAKLIEETLEKRHLQGDLAASREREKKLAEALGNILKSFYACNYTGSIDFGEKIARTDRLANFCNVARAALAEYEAHTPATVPGTSPGDLERLR